MILRKLVGCQYLWIDQLYSWIDHFHCAMVLLMSELKTVAADPLTSTSWSAYSKNFLILMVFLPLLLFYYLLFIWRTSVLLGSPDLKVRTRSLILFWQKQSGKRPAMSSSPVSCYRKWPLHLIPFPKRLNSSLKLVRFFASTTTVGQLFQNLLAFMDRHLVFSRLNLFIVCLYLFVYVAT